ncbi:MAG: periplasmic heavy metal sensor [Pedosphaera sp.]|nr:periplasmic heavy metal sensor [Pedosphaera sp.]MSS99711.1 periplasmic heavy metal sensor [Pedosphaera sp.]
MRIHPTLSNGALVLLALGVSLNIVSAQERRDEPRPRPDAPREPRREQGRPEQPPGERREQPRDGERRPEAQRGQPLQPFQPIELTETQRQAVRHAWDSVREDMMGLGQKMMTARRELNEVVFAEKADADAIRKAAAKLGEAEAEMAIIRQRIIAKVRPTLKPEQLELLKQSPSGFGMLMPGGGLGGEGRPSAQPPRDGQVRPPAGEPRPPREGEARPREGDARTPVRRLEGARGEEPGRPNIERPAGQREVRPEGRRPEGEARPREPQREGEKVRSEVRTQAISVSTVNGRTVVSIGGKQVFEGNTSGRVSAQSITRGSEQLTAVWDGESVIWENVKGAAKMIRENTPRDGGPRRLEGEENPRKPQRDAPPVRRPEGERR